MGVCFYEAWYAGLAGELAPVCGRVLEAKDPGTRIGNTGAIDHHHRVVDDWTATAID